MFPELFIKNSIKIAKLSNLLVQLAVLLILIKFQNEMFLLIFAPRVVLLLFFMRLFVIFHNRAIY